MKALVLSGGGAYGAVQAGMILRLAELRGGWDAVFGISVGAVNALQMAQYQKNNHLNAARDLRQFWCDIRGNESIYKNWGIPLLEGLFGRGGMYDTSPLENFLRVRFRAKEFETSGVKFFVGATELGSGKITYFDKITPDPVKAVMCSAAFPAAFPPVAYGNGRWIDGGVRDTVPLQKAIAEGATEIDVLLTGPQDGASHSWDLKNAGNAALVGLRCVDIMSSEVFVEDQKASNFKGKIRTYAPYAAWDTNPLDFNPAAIRHMMDVGYGIP